MFARACVFYRKQNVEIEQQIDRQEQYSRLNYLLVYGIGKRRRKVTDELVIQTIK